MVHLRKNKVTLRSYLDIAIPDYDACFPEKNIYNPLAMEILKKYPHPSLIIKTKQETMVKYLENKTNHGRNFIIKYVSKVREWANEVYSGCDVDSVIVDKIKELIKHIEEISNEADDILQSIINEAKNECLFT